MQKIANAISEWENHVAEKLIRDWSDLTVKFYDREQVSLKDKFSDKLSDDSGLDGGYLYFRRALEQLKFPNGLVLEEFYRSSQQGRRYYGAIISKNDWHLKTMTTSADGWRLNPDNYNIHFEPQYNVLSGIFSCFLHYEVNPYKPEAWVRTNILKTQYDAYLSGRLSFSKALQAKGLPGWTFSGGSNQLAKATFDFSNSLWLDVKSTLEGAILEATKAIDDVLKEMGTEAEPNKVI